MTTTTGEPTSYLESDGTPATREANEREADDHGIQAGHAYRAGWSDGYAESSRRHTEYEAVRAHEALERMLAARKADTDHTE